MLDCFLYYADCGIVISDGDADLNAKWWLEDLHLYESDRDDLLNGLELSDAVINASQCIMKRQFSHIQGFQSTLLSQNLKFKPFSRGIGSVQILNAGMYVHFIFVVG